MLRLSSHQPRVRSNRISSNVHLPICTQHAHVVHACPRAASTPGSARLSTATAAVKTDCLQDQQMPQRPPQQQQQALPITFSKRQLLAFGACCLSLQAQQQLPAAADSGHFRYAGAQAATHHPLYCIWSACRSHTCCCQQLPCSCSHMRASVHMILLAHSAEMSAHCLVQP